MARRVVNRLAVRNNYPLSKLTVLSQVLLCTRSCDLQANGNGTGESSLKNLGPCRLPLGKRVTASVHLLLRIVILVAVHLLPSFPLL